MKEIPGSFEVRGIDIYRRLDSPTTFFYIPGDPLPEVDFMGRPTLSLLMLEGGSTLQIGVRWDLHPGRAEELKADLASKFPGIDSGSVDVQQAPAEVVGVTVSLGDCSGEFKVLKTDRSSGYSPFNAIFSLPLRPEEGLLAEEAILGKEGFLKVSYRISLPVTSAVKASITGDAGPCLESLGRSPSIEDCAASVKAGISSGKLNLRLSADEGTSQELISGAVEEAVKKAAADLLGMASGKGMGAGTIDLETPSGASTGQQLKEQNFSSRSSLGKSSYSTSRHSTRISSKDESSAKITMVTSTTKARLEASASRTSTAVIVIDRSVDVASWFKDGRGKDNIKRIGVAITGPEKNSQVSGGEPPSAGK